MEVVLNISAIGEDQDFLPDDDAHAGPSTDNATDVAGSMVRKAPRPRGRAPKDPLSQTVKFDISSLEDLEATLRDYLKEPLVPADHATVVFVFPLSAAFMIYNRPANKLHEVPLYGTLSKVAISVMEALRPTMDPREQLEKQRNIAKVCVEAIMAADGFRYQFHNNWISKEDEASRFSYYCNDSPLNKGRAVNEGAGTAGKRKRKEVYECQGYLHIKFSATKSNLEVHYRHIPLHKTFAERAPPPRKESKRRKLMEVFNPELLPKKKEKKVKPPPAPKPPKVPKQRQGKNGPIVAEGAANDNEINLTRGHSLLPLIDYLDGQGQSEGTILNSASADPPFFPAVKLADLRKDQSVVPPRPEKPLVPGAMQGYMDGGGDLVWKSKNRPSIKPKRKVAGEPPPEPLSEVDMLKAKLLEAEQRIQRLEAQKTAPGPPAEYASPYHGLYPPQVPQYPPYPPYCHPHTHPPQPPGFWRHPPPNKPQPPQLPPQKQTQPTTLKQPVAFRPAEPIRFKPYAPPCSDSGPKQRDWIEYEGPRQTRWLETDPTAAPNRRTIPVAGFVNESGSEVNRAAAVANKHAAQGESGANVTQPVREEMNMLRGIPGPAERDGPGVPETAAATKATKENTGPIVAEAATGGESEPAEGPEST